MARRANVCGRNIPIIGTVQKYGGGHIVNARYLGMYAKVSKATAKKLADGRPPKPGWEIKLCGDTWLVNRAGRFEVVSHPGGIKTRGSR